MREIEVLGVVAMAGEVRVTRSGRRINLLCIQVEGFRRWHRIICRDMLAEQVASIPVGTLVAVLGFSAKYKNPDPRYQTEVIADEIVVR